MSSEVVRELFRGLETTLRQRLDVIEDILRASNVSSRPAVTQNTSSDNNKILQTLRDMEDTFGREIANLHATLASVENRVDVTNKNYHSLTMSLAAMNIDIENLKRPRASSAVKTADLPVEAIEAEVEEEVAEAEALEEVEEEEEEMVEEEEEEEEEEVEEEELILEEFTFKGKTYHRDTDNNIYNVDEDGGVEGPIGTWDPVKKRILHG